MQTTNNKRLYSVIGASSLGTLIEWYDFYIFGSLATIISEKFFPPDNPTAAFLATLATFAAGFIVRPFGAIVFGRLGDMIGRKHTFLLTLVLMGGSTFFIGLLPSYATFSGAPLLVLLIRLIQGLALGGEYGGAATYVAEYAPANKRGYFTSWIQTTATMGLFVSLLVIITCQKVLSKEDFNDWGWRLPFLLSIVLVIVSIVIRLKMQESPLFAKLKKEGKTSSNPLKESFGKKKNLKMVLVALFGVTMGQGVVWYTGQFYAQTFLLKNCNIDATQANTCIGIALLIATPFFIVFGALSDKIGRKPIMMAGLLLAVICYRPIFGAMYDMSNIKTKTIVSTKELKTDSKLVPNKQDSFLTDEVEETTTSKTCSDGSVITEVKTETYVAGKNASGKPVIKTSLLLSDVQRWMVIAMVFALVFFVTMVYGPIAAYLVELFPIHIRYTSMSLPYHIGNGVFGGLVPFIGTLIFEYSKTSTNPSGDPLAGLWYPIGIAALCFIIGCLYVTKPKEVKKERIII